ncbi:hypothetical protein Tco_0679931 [Tanacetum coccineum]|uniref:Uncharacterized protein n=1 Tax=Tanacetum coccineum TaxID=301880 RepID=A0ABQ4XKN7_9ASTR
MDSLFGLTVLHGLELGLTLFISGALLWHSYASGCFLISTKSYANEIGAPMPCLFMHDPTWSLISSALKEVLSAYVRGNCPMDSAFIPLRTSF